MSSQLEDFILSEMAKHHSKNIEDKLKYFNQICTRLGLGEDGLKEITPKLMEIFKSEDKSQ